MKNKMNEVYFLFFIFLILILIDVPVSAQQCSELFAETTHGEPDYMVFVGHMSDVTSNLARELTENQKQLHSAQSNRELNAAVLNSVELNNRALGVFEIILAQQSVFKTGAEKMFRNGLIDKLFQLFKSQGFTKTQIVKILDSRVELNDKLQTLTEPRPGPIGFVHGEPEIKGPNPRTIGFNRNELQTEHYGKTSEPVKDVAEKPNDRLEKHPIGFIYDKSDAPTKPLKSIGFVQPESNLDVSYQLSLVFSQKWAVFMAASNRNPIGF